MISKNDILKFVRHVHRRGKGIPDRRSMHPRREWLIGLCIALALTGAGAAVSMINFESYKDIDKRTYATDIAIPIFNEVRAKTVLEDFAARKMKYASLTKGDAVSEIKAVSLSGATSTNSVAVEAVEETVASSTASTAEGDVGQFLAE